MLNCFQVSPAKLALRRHLSQEKLAALESNINFSVGPKRDGHSRSSSTSSADLVIVDTSPQDSQLSNSSGKFSHRLLLGEKLAERGLEVIPTGPPATPPTQATPPVTSPTLATPPTQSSSTTPVDMTVSGNKSVSPRPPSSGGTSVPRPAYSPVSRPNSTDAGGGYSRSPRRHDETNSPATSQPSTSIATTNKPHMPPPSPGRDGLEARLAQIHQSRRTASPAVPCTSNSSNPSAAVITSAIAAAASKYGRSTTSSPSLQPQAAANRPEAPPPVEGLAATLHARFLQQKQHKLPQVLQLCIVFFFFFFF